MYCEGHSERVDAYFEAASRAECDLRAISDDMANSAVPDQQKDCHSECVQCLREGVDCEEEGGGPGD